MMGLLPEKVDGMGMMVERLTWINLAVCHSVFAENRQTIRKGEYCVDEKEMGIQSTLRPARCRNAADGWLQPPACRNPGPIDGGGQRRPSGHRQRRLETAVHPAAARR